MLKKKLLIVLLTAFLAAGFGCGGDDDDSEDGVVWEDEHQMDHCDELVWQVNDCKEELSIDESDINKDDCVAETGLDWNCLSMCWDEHEHSCATDGCIADCI